LLYKKKPLLSRASPRETSHVKHYYRSPTPVLLATWEAEIGKITVPGHPEQKTSRDLISTEKAGYGGMGLSSQ
jgi:hypothetical protein